MTLRSEIDRAPRQPNVSVIMMHMSLRSGSKHGKAGGRKGGMVKTQTRVRMPLTRHQCGWQRKLSLRRVDEIVVREGM